MIAPQPGDLHRTVIVHHLEDGEEVASCGILQNWGAGEACVRLLFEPAGQIFSLEQLEWPARLVIEIMPPGTGAAGFRVMRIPADPISTPTSCDALTFGEMLEVVIAQTHAAIDGKKFTPYGGMKTEYQAEFDARMDHQRRAERQSSNQKDEQK